MADFSPFLKFSFVFLISCLSSIAKVMSRLAEEKKNGK